MKWGIGIVWALMPGILLFLFYSHAFEVHQDSSRNYESGLFLLLAAFASCFVCPIPVIAWCIGRRNKLSAICLLFSIVVAIVCLAIFYFDPGRKIYAFTAD